MNIDEITPWTPLVKGNTDPFMAGLGTQYCMERDPYENVLLCTRAVGHDGLHVVSGHRVCCPSWGIPRDMRLPEGF